MGTKQSKQQPPKESPGAGSSSDWASLMKSLKTNLPTIAAVGGGVVVVYGVSKIVASLTGTFLSMTFTQAAWIGMIAGWISAGAVAGLAMYGYRFVHIRPEFVFRRALGIVRNDERVSKLLGTPVTSGQLRAYSIRDGQFGLDKNDRMSWLAPRVQMLFQVEGSKNPGMVSLEAERQGSKVVMTLLTVDSLHNNDMLLLQGSEDRLKVRGQLRGFLQTERVRYIEQSAEDPSIQNEQDV